MPNLIGLGAGAGATALTLILGLAFWPPLGKAPLLGKAVVTQPVFVASSAPAKANVSAASTGPEGVATAPAADASAMAKLAVALQFNSAPVASGEGPATRSITIAAPSTAAPASEAARRLCAQGLVAMASGDIAGARLYLERAAEAGDTRALMVLGESYDPTTLARMGALGIKGDAAKARDYYAKALAAGMGAARERMAALEAP
jgi:TPR repeat protein